MVRQEWVGRKTRFDMVLKAISLTLTLSSTSVTASSKSKVKILRYPPLCESPHQHIKHLYRDTNNVFYSVNSEGGKSMGNCSVLKVQEI